MSAGVSGVIDEHGAVAQTSVDVVCVVKAPAAAPHWFSSIVSLNYRVCQETGEFDGVIQGCGEQQAVVLSVEGQASDLLGVDGNILTGLHVHHTHLLDSTARYQGGMRRGLRGQQAAQGFTVRQDSAASSLRHQQRLGEGVLCRLSAVPPLSQTQH